VTTHHTSRSGSSRHGSPPSDGATPHGASARPESGDGRGDASLLQRTVEQHANVLFRVAVSIVRDPALADDIVQETFIKAWRFAPLDANGDIPRAWLTRVARNTAISALRGRREDPVRDDDLPAGRRPPVPSKAEPNWAICASRSMPSMTTNGFSSCCERSMASPTTRSRPRSGSHCPR
jgi:DNA-directed RNA polymerase specialized sigma24 family protein